jgi:hypothetical protein
MNREQRRRRAAVLAIAFASAPRTPSPIAPNDVDREIAFDTMIAEMRAQADAPRIASGIPCLLVKGMVSGAGAAGAL